MTLPRALGGLAVLLLAGCLTDPVEGVSGRVGEDGEAPPIGSACQMDVCVDGRSLRVCGADNVFVWDIDCTVNRGECGRHGQREECLPVGWQCETRCTDDQTLEICWSDLSQTTVRCDDGLPGYVCDPDGAFDPFTGETDGVCAPGPDAVADPEDDACACDSFESDPEMPMCCDADCACDIDCQDGLPACGAEGDASAAEGWSCPPDFYGAGDGCDCACGARDPDCDDPEQEIYGCEPGQTCDPDGRCA